MKTYIISILTFASLIIGLTLITVKDIVETQSVYEVSATIPSDIKISNSTLSPAAHYSDNTQTNLLIRTIAKQYGAMNGIFAIDSYSASISSFKNLKYILNAECILNYAFWQRFFRHTEVMSDLFNINYTKYSRKYYLFSISHILI